MTEDNLVALIERNGFKNKKSDKNDFVSYVNNLLLSKFQTMTQVYSEEYSNRLENYLNDYGDSFNKYTADINIDIKFDASDTFSAVIFSVAASGVAGASVIWLARSFTAMSFFIL